MHIKQFIKIQKELEEHVHYSSWLGYCLFKKSFKPFKSGYKFMVAKQLITYQKTGRLAFVLSDDSTIECYKCELRNNVTIKK